MIFLNGSWKWHLTPNAPNTCFNICSICRTLRPEPVRPVPPLHLDEEEMMWTNPMDSDYAHHFELFYDRSMCDAHASLNETKRLMARACKGPLSPANTNQG